MSGGLGAPAAFPGDTAGHVDEIMAGSFAIGRSKTILGAIPAQR
jgi:hypothetical protein